MIYQLDPRDFDAWIDATGWVPEGDDYALTTEMLDAIFESDEPEQ